MDEMPRDKIINKLVEALEAQDFVLALWEGGSKAFDRVDNWSDIDLVADVEDNKVEETFKIVEQTLESLEESGIRETHEVPQPSWHGHYQKFYKLKEKPDYLMVDFVVIKNSSSNKFLEKEVHGDPTVYFDRAEVIENAETKVDVPKLKQKLVNELFTITQRFHFFQFIVQKEAFRGRFLDALGFYQGLTLRPLVMLLRMRYNPFHYNFGLRYLYDELPEEVAQLLEELHAVRNLEDLVSKHRRAIELFEAVEEDLDIDTAFAEAMD